MDIVMYVLGTAFKILGDLFVTGVGLLVVGIYALFWEKDVIAKVGGAVGGFIGAGMFYSYGISMIGDMIRNGHL